MSERKQFTRKALAIVAVALAFSAMAGSRPQAPVGTIHDFLGKEPPAGFLLCNGQAVSRTTYAALFAVIGTRFGSGDGKTTFNLPNFGGKFAESTTSDSSVGTTHAPGVPDISGQVKLGWNDNTAGSVAIVDGEAAGALIAAKGSYFTSFWNDLPTSRSYPRYLKFQASSGEQHGSTYRTDVYGKSDTVQPKSIVVLKIIKY